ncbi:putative fatty acyl-CoA reductase CG5065 [Amyelois transitella]|uniref:putative fatty acyl-CoA reductase CG5065 n=1 Tax=Amyelois transitella TaxID=680683 RepID=UPI00067BA547|nr:putative fatty acyl-CoA reductase CG5065 [Amyelois transitella]XP_013185410.1 putative fatty acyl-CoA reductase CG5065 [Amyelois transitella]XP_013185411.1 putative fatty acyl-CoA reductase CG5065 [Amyelois transitella]XP_060809003.1 putative fatty acyl-CoA reductase CG5065 [Amyelois transitella]
MDFFDRDMSNAPTIPEFYKGKTIFITGGSGFMGKVLIEKLLYSCPEIDRIYLLLRNKRGVRAESRLAQIYASACFDRLRAEKPNIFSEKVFFVGGDVMEPALGLSEEDRALLVNRVNIIFHVAASVRFDDPLPYAVKLNLGGTKQVVEFAKEVRDLSVMLHVSTSYSNTNRDTIEEIMYPPHADWRETMDICENLDEHTIRVLTPKYLGEIPNTYTFTKQLAEHVVYEQKGKLPIVMVRPSIVVSSVSEPVPGWIENFNGPAGILVACGKGIMRSLYTEPDLIADYMPVDISIKSMIVAAWMRGTLKLSSTDDIPIYNCCAGNLNNITMAEMMDIGIKMAALMPLNDMLWNVGGSITTSKTIHYIKVLLLHCLPALFVDALLWLMGRKPMLLKVQRRIYIANLALQYYITKQWNFNNANFVKIRARIKPEDYQHFYYEMETIDRNEYFKMCCIGGRKYLLKERDEDLPKAKAHFTRMVVLDKVVQCIFYGSLFWWLVNTSHVQSVLHFCVN